MNLRTAVSHMTPQTLAMMAGDFQGAIDTADDYIALVELKLAMAVVCLALTVNVGEKEASRMIEFASR